MKSAQDELVFERKRAPVRFHQPALAGGICDDVDAEKLEVARTGLFVHVRQRSGDYSCPHALNFGV